MVMAGGVLQAIVVIELVTGSFWLESQAPLSLSPCRLSARHLRRLSGSMASGSITTISNTITIVVDIINNVTIILTRMVVIAKLSLTYYYGYYYDYYYD